MSETSSLLGASAPHVILGTDYFGFYKQELVELLSQDDDLLPFLPKRPAFVGTVPGVDMDSSLTKKHNLAKDIHLNSSLNTLFSDSVGAHLSDYKRERLRSLVRESVFTFAREIDEMIHPIFNLSRMQSLLGDKKHTLSHQCMARSSDCDHHPEKKQKVSASPSDYCQESGEKPVDVILSEGEKLNTCSEKCEECGKVIPALSSSLPVSKVDDDLQFLMDKDPGLVEKYIKNCSDELLGTIGYMEQRLEEFIDILMSKSRSMTLPEKQKLRKLIQDLPPGNLDRVVEIIARTRPVDGDSCDEIYVDLDNENQVTLWRLYYYVQAVENARKLSES